MANFVDFHSMKRFIIIALSLATSVINMQAQSCRAGIWNSDDFHFNFIPDTAIGPPQINSVIIYGLDVDGNGTTDFYLKAKYSEGYQWYRTKSIKIEGFNGNEVAFSTLDTCWSNDTPPAFYYSTAITKGLAYNAVIDNNLSWADSSVFLSYDVFSANMPNNFGHSCNRISPLLTDTGYIALRLIGLTDTTYGWLKISGVSYNSCVIHEYASCAKPVGIFQETLNRNVSVFPNPTNGVIFINYSNSQNPILQVSLINTLERFDILATGDVGRLQIDLSKYPNGIYFLELKMADGTSWIQKVAKFGF